jgi:hypothetical protein
MMAQQVVNPEKLAEAQEAADAAVEAADAAMEAAKLAAEKVAKVRSGGDLTAKPSALPVANLEKPEADGYRIIRNGPQDFSVEGFFSKDDLQKFSLAHGFPSEAAARQWVYDQLAGDE